MTPVARSLAAMATRPGREAALEQALASLRPQVERLHVVCHDVETPPDCVRTLADAWVCEPDVRGSAAKLHWADAHAGLYLGCDDDFAYPADYVATMLRWVKRWKGRAIVTCHGRRLPKKATRYLDADLVATPRTANKGDWLNYPGACSIAWDTRLKIPSGIGCEKNLEEAYLACWAQAHRVPIWLVPKPADWLRYLLPEDAGPTIWHAEKSSGFANRNRIIGSYTADRGGWKVHRAA